MAKVLVDLSPGQLNNLQEVKYGSIMAKILFKSMQNGICIPDTTTNGQLLMLMFPGTKVTYHEADNLVDAHVTVSIKGCDTWQDYSLTWWNEPAEIAQYISMYEEVRE